MFGEILELITIRCCVCKKMVALRVDLEDVACHEAGMLAQHAFPYLKPDERELFISAVCPSCYSLLCPSDRLAYN